MRSVAFLLAIGLGVDFALAGPCKPRTSATDVETSTSTGSTTQLATTTAGELSSMVTSETSTETVATTVASDTTTAIITTTSETETTTAAADTTIAVSTTTSNGETTTAATDTTTIAITTTTSGKETTTTAEVTTTAPAATPTFTIVGGGGSVNGAPLQGVDQGGSVLLFNAEVGNVRTRTFILDPDTGRLRDKDTGILVCAYYGFAESSSDPAHFAYCQSGNTGSNLPYAYLTCEIVSGKLACTAPKGSCPDNDDGSTSCFTDSTGGVNNQFYYAYQSGAGNYLYISSGSPSGYTSVDILAQNA